MGVDTSQCHNDLPLSSGVLTQSTSSKDKSRALFSRSVRERTSLSQTFTRENIKMGSFSVGLRCVSALVIFLSYIIWPVIRLFSSKRRRIVPRSTNPIFTNSAYEIAIKIRRKQISCEEVITLFIQRLKEVNPILNAIVEDRYEKALEEAKSVDEFLSSTELTEDQLEKQKPLLGVPMTIKENLSIKGMSLAVGSRTRLGKKAEEDGECVRRLMDAGAIPMCLTNTPEFCMSVETYNKVTGVTSNPYNTHYNSGGSSGGEGALIGSGASTCGIGSDIGGSIRIPSSFNGIFGHKPSPGLVSLKGHFPTSDDPMFAAHLTIGPMARYSEDLPLITKVLAGANAEKIKLDQPVDLTKLKVLHMEDCGSNFGLLEVQKEIKEAIGITVNHLKDTLNCEVIEVAYEEMKYASEHGIALHFSMKNDEDPLENVNIFTELIKCALGKSIFPFNTLIYGLSNRNKTLIPGTLKEHEDDVKKFKRDIINDLGDNGILIFPSFPTSALPHMGSVYGTIGAGYLMIFNILGLPATNVPVGFDGKGLPVGIQIVAAPDNDRLCFAVAKELETVFGGWKPPY